MARNEVTKLDFKPLKRFLDLNAMLESFDFNLVDQELMQVFKLEKCDQTGIL